MERFKKNFSSQNNLDFGRIGFNVFSPTYEDGILLFIFSLIGMTNRKFIDIGCGLMNGSSVANLIINHSFSGILVDGNEQHIKLTRNFYASHPETSLLPIITKNSFLNAENINDFISQNGINGEIDLLCIDIDGIDYWIWKAIDVIQPRVVLLEYQDILGPDVSWTVPYKSDFCIDDYDVNKEMNNYCGASLRALTKLSKKKGYRLIGCNKGGWNAFYIRNDIASDILPEVSIESCFKYEWNEYGIKHRLPKVENMEWEEV